MKRDMNSSSGDTQPSIEDSSLLATMKVEETAAKNKLENAQRALRQGLVLQNAGPRDVLGRPSSSEPVRNILKRKKPSLPKRKKKKKAKRSQSTGVKYPSVASFFFKSKAKEMNDLLTKT